MALVKWRLQGARGARGLAGGLCAASLALTAACSEDRADTPAPLPELKADAAGPDAEGQAPASGVEPVSEPTGDAIAEPDIWSLVIESERWGVMIDQANDGAIQTALANRGASSGLRSDLYRVDYALRRGVRDLLALRDGLCVDDISPQISCTPIVLPAWVSMPPDVMHVSLSEYQRRSDWLGEALQPFVTAGCGAGRNATGDDMFCAVE